MAMIVKLLNERGLKQRKGPHRQQGIRSGPTPIIEYTSSLTKKPKTQPTFPQILKADLKEGDHHSRAVVKTHEPRKGLSCASCAKQIFIFLRAT